MGERAVGEGRESKTKFLSQGEKEEGKMDESLASSLSGSFPRRGGGSSQNCGGCFLADMAEKGGEQGKKRKGGGEGRGGPPKKP